MTALVLVELVNGQPHPATANVITAAKACASDVKLLAFSGDTLLAEAVAPLIAERAKSYSHVLVAATTTWKDILPRAAALLDVQQISDITQVVSADTFVHPIYAGNALETVKSSDALKLLTVRPTAFAPSPVPAVDETIAAPSSPLSSLVSQEKTASERPDLAQAKVVVAGGRGLGSKENFAILERIADKLGGALAASRAAVDAGYAPNDWQVGQTGKVVAPELYLAVGISGAIQHVAGMKDSKVVVAINKDENAPIFEIADYGLVADLFIALPELEALLK